MPLSSLELSTFDGNQKHRCVGATVDYRFNVDDFEFIEELVEKWESLPESDRKPEQQWVIDVVRTLDLIEEQGLLGFWRSHGRDANRILQSLRVTGNSELATALDKSRFCQAAVPVVGSSTEPKALSASEKAQLNRLLFDITDRIDAARDGLVELLPRADSSGSSDEDQEPATPTLNVEVTERLSCPYCGQSMELVVDTSIAQQRSTTDCEVCCRPFEVVLECDPGAVTSIEIEA